MEPPADMPEKPDCNRYEKYDEYNSFPRMLSIILCYT
jgi:hypothetical protein